MNQRPKDVGLLFFGTFPKVYRFFCFLLILLFFSTVLGFIFQLNKGFDINADLRALLPGYSDENVEKHASQKLQSGGLGRIVVLFSSADLDIVKSHVSSFQEKVGKGTYWNVSPLGDNVDEFEQFTLAAREYKFHVLSLADRSLLLSDNSEQLVGNANRELFQPSSWSRVLPIVEDPLNTFNHWLVEKSNDGNGLTFATNYLHTTTADKSGEFHGLVPLDLAYEVTQISEQSHAVDELNQFVEDTLRHGNSLDDGGAPSVRVSRSGTIFFTDEAAKQAQQEIKIISLGSIVGIVFLYLFSFRSLLPLFMSVMAILFGGFVSVVTVHAMFGSIHLITLVFGASLIGVSVDYALHFLAKLYHSSWPGLVTGSTSDKVLPLSALKHVFSGIAIALVTTVVSYLCLIQASMPGLYQIALFSIVGLISSWVFVVAAFPLVFCEQPYGKYSRLRNFAQLNMQIWSNVSVKYVVIVFLFVFTCFFVVVARDFSLAKDVRALHRPSDQLLLESTVVHEVSKTFAANQFFIVTGHSPQSVLELEESFGVGLSRLVEQGAIRSYNKVTNYIPSIKRQSENYRLLSDTLYSSDKGVFEFMAKIGVGTKEIMDYKNTFMASEGREWPFGIFLTKAPSLAKNHWLGRREDGKYSSIISLSGVGNLSALRSLGESFESVEFVDRVQTISDALASNSQQAIKLLFMAYAFIGFVLFVRYRQVSILILVLLPMMSSMCVLFGLTLFSVPVSLFHIFGLYLILGLGLDYGVFLRESVSNSLVKDENDTVNFVDGSCWIAINLSALTSCLSFGLMSLSSTPMVSAFGLTVLVGSMCNLLLAPLVLLVVKKSVSLNA